MTKIQYILRPWKQEDLASVVKHADNPAITSCMSDGFPDTESKWEAFLKFAVNAAEVLYYAIEVGGAAVGGIGVSPQREENQKSGELGYWISEVYWGKGVMTRAVREMVERTFTRFDIDRIFAAPYAANFASHRVLEKAGFVLEARLEKSVMKAGVATDQLIYVVNRHSWNTMVRRG